MVQFVMCQDMHIGATSPIFSGPRLARPHTVVTENSEAQSLPFDNRRLSCLHQIHARAGGRDAEPAEFGDRIFHAIRSGVGYVIPRERRHVEPGTLEGSEMRRIAGWRRNVEMRLYTTSRMRNFDVPHKHVARLELIACQVE